MRDGSEFVGGIEGLMVVAHRLSVGMMETHESRATNLGGLTRGGEGLSSARFWRSFFVGVGWRDSGGGVRVSFPVHGRFSLYEILMVSIIYFYI